MLADAIDHAPRRVGLTQRDAVHDALDLGGATGCLPVEIDRFGPPVGVLARIDVIAWSELHNLLPSQEISARERVISSLESKAADQKALDAWSELHGLRAFPQASIITLVTMSQKAMFRQIAIHGCRQVRERIVL